MGEGAGTVTPKSAVPASSQQVALPLSTSGAPSLNEAIKPLQLECWKHACILILAAGLPAPPLLETTVALQKRASAAAEADRQKKTGETNKAQPPGASEKKSKTLTLKNSALTFNPDDEPELPVLAPRSEDSELRNQQIDSALSFFEKELKSEESGAASVPKPLKYTQPFVEMLEQSFSSTMTSLSSSAEPHAMPAEQATRFADIMAVLVMAGLRTIKKPKTTSLFYRHNGSKEKNLGEWGYELVKNLVKEIISKEIANADNMLSEGLEETQDKIAREAIQYLWTKGAYIEALDLLCEMNWLEETIKTSLPMDSDLYPRIANYLIAMSEVSVHPDDALLINICFSLYCSHGDMPGAMYCAMWLKSKDKILQLLKFCNPRTMPSAEEIFGKENLCFSTSTRRETEYKSVLLNMSTGGGKFDDADREQRRLIRIQLCLIVARNSGWRIKAGDFGFESTSEDNTDFELVEKILSWSHVNELYQYLGKELEVSEPRSPEDVLASSNARPGSRAERRQTARLASTAAPQKTAAEGLVNGFLNCGFNSDKSLLMSETPPASLFQMTGQALMTNVASLGLICLYDLEQGLNAIDKFQYSTNIYAKAGALLAFGINACKARDDYDSALKLLEEPAGDTNETTMLENAAAVEGLGIAYAASNREELTTLLVPVIVGDTPASPRAAMSLSMAFAGSADPTVAEALLQVLTEKQQQLSLEESLEPRNWNFCLAMGLLYLSVGSAAAEEFKETLKCALAEDHPLTEMALVCVDAAAVFGTGNPSDIQNLIHSAIKMAQQRDAIITVEQQTPDTEPKEAETAANFSEGLSAPSLEPVPAAPVGAGAGAAEAAVAAAQAAAANIQAEESGGSSTSRAVDTWPQAVASARSFSLGITAIGVAGAAMRERLGEEMVIRMAQHLLQFDSLPLRRSVPLMLGLAYVSNPLPNIVDLLGRLSHDNDADVALHAIISLGLVGAGTNNTRIAQILKQTAGMYSNDTDAKPLVDLSRGLLFLGKGLLTLSPVVGTEPKIFDMAGMAGLWAFVGTALNAKTSLLEGTIGQAPPGLLSYFRLATAIRPRWLITVSETLEPLSKIDLRVGKALDTAGLPPRGAAKTLTGFQTHASPVLISAGEKAEIVNNDVLVAFSSCLEDLLIVKSRQ